MFSLTGDGQGNAVHSCHFTLALPKTAWLPRGRLGTLHAFGCTWPTTSAPMADMLENALAGFLGA